MPDCTPALTFRLGLPHPRRDGLKGAWTLSPPWLTLRKFRHIPNRAGHYWEIGRRGTSLSRVRRCIRASTWRIQRELRTPENAYHRFFVLR